MLYQWPVVSICLSATAVSFFLVFLVANAGWPGPVTSNCYEDYLITADCYCERLRGDQPGDAWFAQPMNTFSNLWFVVSGLLIAYAADSRSFPSKEWWNTRSNLITQDKLYSTVYCLTACFVGVGSFCFHASFTTWGRQLDMLAMYFLASFGLVFLFLKRHQVSKEQAIWMYCVMNACLAYWTLVADSTKHTREVFTLMIISSWSLELFHIDQETAQCNKKARRILLGNICIFIFAVLVWKASESDGPWCDPESIWQGHSFWHFLTALAVAIQYFYYLAENQDPFECKIICDKVLDVGTSVDANSCNCGLFDLQEEENLTFNMGRSQ